MSDSDSDSSGSEPQHYAVLVLPALRHIPEILRRNNRRVFHALNAVQENEAVNTDEVQNEAIIDALPVSFAIPEGSPGCGHHSVRGRGRDSGDRDSGGRGRDSGDGDSGGRDRGDGGGGPDSCGRGGRGEYQNTTTITTLCGTQMFSSSMVGSTNSEQGRDNSTSAGVYIGNLSVQAQPSPTNVVDNDEVDETGEHPK